MVILSLRLKVLKEQNINDGKVGLGTSTPIQSKLQEQLKQQHLMVI